MSEILPNKITGANAGEPRLLAMVTQWARPHRSVLSLAVNTASKSAITTFASIVLMVTLSGCVLPYSEAGSTVYARTSQDNKTNEIIAVVYRHHGWMNVVTPEGPQYLSTSARKRHYYFSDHRVSGRSLSFLQGNADVDWELLAPIEATKTWVRVEARGRFYAASGTNIVITVFTPHELLHQHSIATKGIPYKEFLQFMNGNRTVSYKSESDVFAYDAVRNNLTKDKAE
jgi:hypothetical protein